MFYLMYGTLNNGITSTLAHGIDQNGRFVVHMMPNTANFWNVNVWKEWKERFPDCATWINNYPKDHLTIHILQLSDD